MLKYFILDSYFLNNTGIYDDWIEQQYLILSKTSFTTKPNIHQDNDGGAIHAITQNITIIECYFKSNSAYRGASIYLNFNNELSMQSLAVLSCIFNENESGNHGGGISIGGLKEGFNGLVTSSFFLNNFAFNSMYFFFL